jgi:putative MFS transporter
VTALLAKAAFFSIPGAVLAAWLYGRSAKKAMVAFAATSALSLGVFWAFGPEVVASPTLFTVVLVALLVSMWGSISVLCPYSAEVYPTAVRATGAGLAAGASKVGGVLALAMAILAITPPDLTGAALMSAMPMLLAAVVVGIVGVETAGRPLDSIARRDTEMSPALR